MQDWLSINFLPNAIYKPELCTRTTLQAARKHDIPVERLLFEATEGEAIEDGKRLGGILTEYKRTGFLTAIDDFGAGYAGLNLLADFQPDIIELDMALMRGVDTSRSRQAITRGVLRMCFKLDIAVIAEGIETEAERDFFFDEVSVSCKAICSAGRHSRGLARSHMVHGRDQASPSHLNPSRSERGWVVSPHSCRRACPACRSTRVRDPRHSARGGVRRAGAPGRVHVRYADCGGFRDGREPPLVRIKDRTRCAGARPQGGLLRARDHGTSSGTRG